VDFEALAMPLVSLLCLIIGALITSFAPYQPALHVVLEITGLVVILLGLVSLPK
jgi:hypothetical protein